MNAGRELTVTRRTALVNSRPQRGARWARTRTKSSTSGPDAAHDRVTQMEMERERDGEKRVFREGEKGRKKSITCE
jgi:hypothetical protein